MPKNSPRLGVDIGGTFTEVVLEHAEHLYSTKVLTTYTAPEDAFMEGMNRVCDAAGVATDEIG
jgi:N-methylhydantoinase A